MSAMPKGTILPECDIQLHAKEVVRIIKSGDNSELITKLENFSFAQRQKIVNYLSGLNAPIPTACRLHHEDMINFLLTKCGADVNRRENGSFLWNAVDVNDINLAQALVEKGADIDSVSDSGVPVLHRALGHGTVRYITEGESLDGAISVVQDYSLASFLIERGADVNIKDTDQRTSLNYLTTDTPSNREMVKYMVQHGADLKTRCSDEMTYLMLSILRQNVWLCQYLISNGVELNATDIKGRTALHYTCKREILSKNQWEFMKILIDAGIYVNVVDKEGLSAIQLAASNHCPLIVDYLANLESVPMTTKSSAYDILGAMLSTKANAYESWTKALNLRLSTSPTDSRSCLSQGPIIEGAEDLFSREKLEDLTDSDELLLRHSLYILDRYLGRHSLYTLYKLKELAMYYWKRKEPKQGIKTVKYSFCLILNGNKCMLTDWSCTNTLRDIFSTWYKYFDEIDQIVYSEVVDIVSGFTHQVELLCSACYSGNSRPASNASDVFVDCISMLFYLQKNDSDSSQFTEQMKRLVDLDERFNQTLGHSILHKVLTRRYTMEQKQADQRIQIAECLIRSGISVNVRDSDKNTALHVICLDTRNIQFNLEIVKFLLDLGTHVDIRNKQGETVLSLMERLGMTICKVGNTTLQCLAASVIMAEKLTFRNAVPKFLESFIELH